VSIDVPGCSSAAAHWYCVWLRECFKALLHLPASTAFRSVRSLCLCVCTRACHCADSTCSASQRHLLGHPACSKTSAPMDSSSSSFCCQCKAPAYHVSSCAPAAHHAVFCFLASLTCTTHTSSSSCFNHFA
jgi:hypothetical protein